VFAGLGMAAPGSADGGKAGGSAGGRGYIKYSTVMGYFLQDDPATDWETFDYVCHPAQPRAMPYCSLQELRSERLWWVSA
jgi:hypothetical protein